MRWTILLGWALLMSNGVDATTWADDEQVTMQLPLKAPRSKNSALGGPTEAAEFTIWIPNGVRVARGAICNPFSKMEPPSAHWQAACRYWQFAYIAADFDGIRKDEFGLLETALVEAARSLKHPELAHLPLCFLGMSRGGGMSMNFGERLPARTIACVPVCLEVGPNSDAARQIPVLTVFGDKDGSQLTRLLEKLPIQRGENARWAIAVQWGRGHEFGQANNLAFVFLDDVIRARLPLEPVADGPTPLKPFPLDRGWLGGPITWVKNQPVTAAPSVAPFAKFEGDKSNTVWLPSARAAAVWQAFVSSSKQVKINEPAGLGDGQKFATLPPNQPLKVSAAVSGESVTSVELWDADVKLDTRTAAPWEWNIEPLAPGIHSLIVKAIVSGETRSSRPHTIVVGD